MAETIHCCQQVYSLRLHPVWEQKKLYCLPVGGGFDSFSSNWVEVTKNVQRSTWKTKGPVQKFAVACETNKIRLGRKSKAVFISSSHYGLHMQHVRCSTGRMEAHSACRCHQATLVQYMYMHLWMHFCNLWGDGDVGMASGRWRPKSDCVNDTVPLSCTCMYS